MKKIQRTATSSKQAMKAKVEKILNNLTVDASVFYEENGAVCIKIAPWHDSNDVTDEPKTIPGRMVFKGKNHEGDGGKFVPYNQTGKTLFTTLLKTPHGEMKTTPHRMMVQFAFWKSEDKEATMRALYNEVMDMKRFVKSNISKHLSNNKLSNKENITWEEMKQSI